ncbi:MAG: hypothetical protein RLY43_1235 [Bacteroidota bacterium]|jgi:hypothetical protein
MKEKIFGRKRSLTNEEAKVEISQTSLGLEKYYSLVDDGLHCLYKIICNGKFIIHKSKTLSGGLFLIEKGFAYFKAYEHKASGNQKDYYFKFYNHLVKNPDAEVTVEVVMAGTNPLEILIKEQELLIANRRNKKCLNNNITSYIPVYREKTNSYGWISKDDVDAFKQHLEQIGY